MLGSSSIWTPLIFFFAAVSVVLATAGVWSIFFGSETKALAERLNKISKAVNQADTHTLDQAQPEFEIKWVAWLLSEAPWARRLERLILQSGSTLRPYHLLIACALTGVIGLLISAVIFGFSGLNVLILTAFSAFIPVFVLLKRSISRQRKISEQLPDALDFMTRALRSGNAFTPVIGMAGEQLASPICDELKITFDQMNYGLPLDKALINLVDRVPSDDLRFLVTSLLIQRDIGGNLTELFDSLAKIIRERAKLYGKVRVLIAEGKFSAILLTGMPFAAAFILNLINPGYVSVLWTTEVGKDMVGAGLGMIVLGFMFLWKIVQIKV